MCMWVEIARARASSAFLMGSRYCGRKEEGGTIIYP